MKLILRTNIKSLDRSKSFIRLSFSSGGWGYNYMSDLNCGCVSFLLLDSHMSYFCRLGYYGYYLGFKKNE